jgi:hypothetical protein
VRGAQGLLHPAGPLWPVRLSRRPAFQCRVGPACSGSRLQGWRVNSGHVKSTVRAGPCMAVPVQAFSTCFVHVVSSYVYTFTACAAARAPSASARPAGPSPRARRARRRAAAAAAAAAMPAVAIARRRLLTVLGTGCPVPESLVDHRSPLHRLTRAVDCHAELPQGRHTSDPGRTEGSSCSRLSAGRERKGMARKKVREADAKKLLAQHFARLNGRDLAIRVAQVDGATDYAALLKAQPWLGTSKLVVRAERPRVFSSLDPCAALGWHPPARPNPPAHGLLGPGPAQAHLGHRATTGGGGDGGGVRGRHPGRQPLPASLPRGATA